MMGIMGLNPSDFTLEDVQAFINIGETSREEIVAILSEMEKIVSIEDLRNAEDGWESEVPELSIEEALIRLNFGEGK
jgi:hypothetical protein